MCGQDITRPSSTIICTLCLQTNYLVESTLSTKIFLMTRLYSLIIGSIWVYSRLAKMANFSYAVVTTFVPNNLINKSTLSEDCDLVANRHQARTWTSDNLNHWCIWPRRLFGAKVCCKSAGLDVFFAQIDKYTAKRYRLWFLAFECIVTGAHTLSATLYIPQCISYMVF